MYTVTKDVTFNAAAAIFWVTGGPSHASSNTIVIHTSTLETPLGTTRSFKENNKQPVFEMGNLFPARKEVQVVPNLSFQDIDKALLLAWESNDFRRVTFVDSIRDGVEIIGWNLQAVIKAMEKADSCDEYPDTDTETESDDDNPGQAIRMRRRAGPVRRARKTAAFIRKSGQQRLAYGNTSYHSHIDLSPILPASARQSDHNMHSIMP
ncbi:hypothetical protein B0H14DRAFT_2584621 [Mycena olivaceomarginata]|nr:hypothetical protein B0H14DRAFT_2584621 [Mycena olivaceomarginata]